MLQPKSQCAQDALSFVDHAGGPQDSEGREKLRPARATSRIRWLGIPTCNRLQQLQSCIVSYVTHLHPRRRDFDLVVVDDSPGAAEREACRKWLRAYAKHCRLAISYAGEEEKRTFIARLERAGIAPAPIRFALSNSLAIPSSPGANRNALLLHTLGDMALSCDDDTLGQIRDLRYKTQTPRCVPFGNNYMDVHFLPGRQAAVGGAEQADYDILSAHEELLGRSIAEIGVSGAPFAALTTNPPPGKIDVTMSGVLGDPGIPDMMGFLFSRGKIRERFLDHWNGNAEAPERLNVICGVSSPVVSREAHTIMTTATGLDNRSSLPPFMPSGKGEDVAYGLLMRKCFPDSYTGIVPVAVLHARASSSIRQQAGSFLPVYDFLSVMLEACSDSGPRGRHDGLKKIGTYLVECGELPLADFKQYLKRIAVLKIGRLIRECDRLLNEFHSEPEHWASEILAVMRWFEEQLLHPELGLPGDLPGTDSQSRYLAFGRFVRDLGELLRSWPDIVAATLYIQNSGYRIGCAL
jgi:hypothetical protein